MEKIIINSKLIILQDVKECTYLKLFRNRRMVGQYTYWVLTLLGELRLIVALTNTHLTNLLKYVAVI